MKRRRAVKRLEQSARVLWAMEPTMLAQWTELTAHVAAGGAYDFTGRKIGGEAPPSGQIGVLNIVGSIQKRADFWMEIFGGTSTDVLGRAFDRMIQDGNVSAIVLNVDSPGGTVSGVPELAAKIFAARGTKPIIAVANGMMASAALWIASAADEIVAIPSTPGVGSIGVLQLHMDQSKALENEGVKPTFITSAKFKAEGNPYEPLSDAAKAHLQARVDVIHEEFIEAIALHRGVSTATVEAKFGQGRTLLAEQAKAVGLVDRIATLEDVLRELGGSTSAGSVVAQSPGTPKGGCSMHPKVKLALVDRGLATVASDDAHCKAALDLFYAAKGNAVPTDPEAIVKDLSPFAASSTLIEGETLTTLTAQPAAVGRDDLISLVQTAGAGLQSGAQMELLKELSKDSKLTLTGALDKINAAVTAATPIVGSGGVVVTRDATDKLRAEARDALICRALEGQKLPETIYDRASQEDIEFKPSKASKSLASLPRLGGKVLENAGVPRNQIDNLQVADIASIACGANPSNYGLTLSASDAHYNVTGMFSNILLDAQNALLRRSYDDGRTTFQLWAKRGESLQDFKPVNKIIGGEVGDPKAIGEDGEFEETTLADGKETYKLNVWGEIFSVTWQVIVNDRLSAFTEVPMKLGRAMRRKQNRLVYGILKDNATLADTGALFNGTAVSTPGGHANLTTGSVSDYAAAFATMIQKMAVQKGLSTDSGALNLRARFCLAPTALADKLGTLLRSTFVPGTSSHTTNIYQGIMELILDAELDAAFGGSATAFYHVCDSADIDTVEYAYLSGYETPRLEMENSFSTLGMRYRIFQPFAAKSLDYRGMQQHTGA